MKRKAVFVAFALLSSLVGNAQSAPRTSAPRSFAPKTAAPSPSPRGISRLIERNYDELKDILTRQDALALVKTHPASYDKLTPQERSEISLMLAKSLSIRPFLESLDDQSWREISTWQEWIAFRKKYPPSGPLGMRLNLNSEAARHLRGMAERQLVAEPQVIPLLIEALEHPHVGVGSDVYYSLEFLTQRTTGHECFVSSEYTATKKVKDDAVRWWRDWWEATKDKHPIVDAALQEQARHEVLRVARLIESRLKPRYAELSMFRSPEWPAKVETRRPWVYFHVEYDPRRWSLPFSVRVKRETLPWLQIASGFSTPDGPGAQIRPEVRKPPRELEGFAKTVYSKQIPGTDVVVSVTLASPNEELAKEMEKLLKDSDSGGARANHPSRAE